MIEGEGSAWNVGAGLVSQQRNPNARVCWAEVEEGNAFQRWWRHRGTDEMWKGSRTRR